MTNQSLPNGPASIEIFTGANCGYCERAKALLTSKHLPYTEFDIASHDNRSEMLQRLPRAKTIPQIFIDGSHIGGCDDLVLLASRGGLDGLTQAGARP